MKKFILIYLSSLFFVVSGFAYNSDAFVLVINTNNDGEGENLEFMIPTNPSVGGYNYNVDCNNNGTNEIIGATAGSTCSYDTAGVYTVVITGNYPAIYHHSSIYNHKITDIKQWGTQVWKSMEYAFSATDFTITDTNYPDLSQVHSMEHIFGYSRITSDNLAGWNVSNVTNMKSAFADARSFDVNIGGWNVSSVEDMSYMFQGAVSFNQNINGWDVSSVKDMTTMFNGASNFNVDIRSWDVSSVKNMSYMFRYMYAFNKDIGSWDVSSVLDMSYMFHGTTSFNQDISDWNVSKVTDMKYMFKSATAFNQDIGVWDVSSVTDMSYMFWDATMFNQDLGDWNISKVIRNHDSDGLSGMFQGLHLSVSNYDSLLSSWSKLTFSYEEDFLLYFGSGYTSKYCDQASKDILLAPPNNWQFSDGGQDCSFHITTPNEVTVTNKKLYVTQLETNFTNDPEFPSLTYTLVEVADADKFTLTQGGKLSFKNLPNTDNIYRVQIQAHEDEDGVDDYKTIKVKVVSGSASTLVPTIIYLLN